MLEGARVATSGQVVDLSSADFTVQTNTTPSPLSALYVGVSGDVKVDFSEGGIGIVLKGVAAGVAHPMSIRKIYKVGTTATDMVYLK